MSNAEVNERTELYTKRSMEDLSSPDQLRDHLKVTGVPVWIIMIAILVLLLGLFAWSAFATLTSYTSANGTVQGGVMAVTLQGEALEKSTLEGTGDKMVCLIGDMETVLTVSGTDAEGNRIAVGPVPLPDGSYDVRIGFRQAKAIELLLN